MNSEKSSLISVIIPCYNQAQFLRDAIESVLKQTYKVFEIIVIDDGSTDHTKNQALAYRGIRYVYQPNAGLSAARNKGIELARGEYLVFLDADDWLYSDALESNLNYLFEHSECAFVSGAHTKVNLDGEVIREEAPECVECRHYEKLLSGNYIGMHGTVMYHRWIFDSLKFDTTLKSCEDYDLYLKIARTYPIGCHRNKIAVYRQHSQSMSANIPWMLKSVLAVHERQKPFLRNTQEQVAFSLGTKVWKEYYSTLLFSELSTTLDKNSWPSRESLEVLVKEKPATVLPYLFRKSSSYGRQWLKSKLPDSAIRLLTKGKNGIKTVPDIGKINAGDFLRSKPFSEDFGFDRGGAIDRYYIEKFLKQNCSAIKGNVLEIGGNDYTMKFGNLAELKSDVLHVNSENAKATIIGDLSNLLNVSDNRFDCIILTQTLQLIYDVKGALATCYRILKPGGVLLLTVPGISQIDKGEWKSSWLWSFTEASVKRLLSDTFVEASLDVKTFGNVFVASSFLYGVGLPEFPAEMLEKHDESYPVIISAKVRKQEEYGK
jgi:glycosyltransferase involved in cell wall biosynthesis